MKWRKKAKEEIVIEVDENTFTSLQQDAIMASMICLDEAFMIARKRKDVASMIEIADKWYGLSQAFEDEPVAKKSRIGFNIDIQEEENE